LLDETIEEIYLYPFNVGDNVSEKLFKLRDVAKEHVVNVVGIVEKIETGRILGNKHNGRRRRHVVARRVCTVLTIGN